MQTREERDTMGVVEVPAKVTSESYPFDVLCV